MSYIPKPRPSAPDISRGPDLIIVKWLTVIVAILLVSLRFYVGVLRKKLGWDDYTILLAVVFAIAESVFSIFQVHSGFGRNIYYLTTVQIQHIGLFTTICIMLLIVGTSLVRTSVCLFVLRLVPVTRMSYRRWIWGLLAFCTIPSLANFLAQCFQCVPLSGLWDKTIKARCMSEADMTMIIRVQGSSAVITNLLCALLPMLVIRNLQINQRDKIAILIVIGLGFFTAATAIARVVLSNFSSKNPTWDLFPVAIWACLEQNIGISVASMPALYKFIKTRKRPSKSHSPEELPNHHHNNVTRPPPISFARLSDSDRIYLPDDISFTETSSGQSSSLPPKTTDIESCHDSRASLIRLSMTSPPIWAERKISSAETVEMSRVSPTATIVERKPSSFEKASPNMASPSWGHKKTSSFADKANKPNKKRLSLVSPLSMGRPSSPVSAVKVQQGGRFEETGLRTSRVATPEEMMTLGNPATMGYSCRIEGGTPKATPKPSPKPSPTATPTTPKTSPKPSPPATPTTPKTSPKPSPKLTP